jgi:hypothetical protein
LSWSWVAAARAAGVLSGGRGVKGGDADQVVDGGGELEPGSVAGLAAEANRTVA